MSRSILIICLLIILAAGIVFVLWPKLQDFGELRVQVLTKEKELEYKKEYFNKLNQILEKLKTEYAESVAKIDSAFPSDPSMPSLLKFLQSKASENGLILQEIKLGKSGLLKGDARIRENEAVVSLIGSYPALKNFLFVIEQSARLIEVQSLSFPREKEITTQSEILNFDLAVKTYSY